MSKEKQIQDELERYWGQLDRIEGAIVKNKHRIGAVGGQLERLEKSLIFLRNQINRFDKVERMLKWLVIECIPIHKRKNIKQFSISDILGGK